LIIPTRMALKTSYEKTMIKFFKALNIIQLKCNCILKKIINNAPNILEKPTWDDIKIFLRKKNYDQIFHTLSESEMKQNPTPKNFHSLNSYVSPSFPGDKFDQKLNFFGRLILKFASFRPLSLLPPSYLDLLSANRSTPQSFCCCCCCCCSRRSSTIFTKTLFISIFINFFYKKKNLS
jgi:hypothetical protein